MKEAQQYEQAMDLLIDNLKECNKIIANLKQRSFTNSQMVTRFYGRAEVDIVEALLHLENGFELHKNLVDNYGLKINSKKIWI